MMFYRGVKTLEGNVEVEYAALKKYVRMSETEEKPKFSDYRKFILIKPAKIFPAEFVWSDNFVIFLYRKCAQKVIVLFSSNNLLNLLINSATSFLQFKKHLERQSLLALCWSPTNSLVECSFFYSALQTFFLDLESILSHRKQRPSS